MSTEEDKGRIVFVWFSLQLFAGVGGLVNLAKGETVAGAVLIAAVCVSLSVLMAGD